MLSLIALPSTPPNGAHQKPELELLPCPNKFTVKEKSLNNDAFTLTDDNNEPNLSWKDRKFLDIMDRSIHKNESGHWEMPLPFREEKPFMPNNRDQAFDRLIGLLRNFKRNPETEKDYIEFMEKVIDKGHASPVSPDELEAKPGKVWYLPHFGIRHPKKKSIRVVFDSSAEFNSVSPNKQLLPGPDLMNNLLGVLMRFRKENFAIMCDIEQMFFSFHVNPEHRDFLRFLWFRNNDPKQPIIEYRMNVHLFGNGPSPATATYSLRKTVDGEEKLTSEVQNFLCRNFYVDDGIISKPSTSEVIDLVRKTQAAQATANLRLHKVVSNSIEVMQAFPSEDRAKDIRDLDLNHDALPAQRSLGVCWDL